MVANTVALTELQAGERGWVAELAGGTAFQHRLAAMGLTLGREVSILQAPGRGGPRLVAVGRARLALGHGMAEKVIVRRLQTNSEVPESRNAC